MRRRAANAIGAEMTTLLTVLEGSLANGAAGNTSGEVRQLIDTGEPLAGTIRALVHGEVTRKDFDKAPVVTWMSEAKKRVPTMAARTDGPAWKPSDPATARLAAGGTQARGVIAVVEKNGWGNERVADLKVTVRLDDADGTALVRSLSIPVREAPREGDRVEVRYDPSSPDRFVYRADVSPAAAASTPDSRVDQLGELARLHEKGLLTREEFEAEKTRLLGS